MDDWALSRVFDGTAQDFMGQGGSIAFTEKDEPHDVNHRIDVCPVKVDVGDASGGLLQVDEQSGNGIGDRGAPGVEDTIGAFAEAPGSKRYSVKSEVSPRSTSTK